MITGPQGCGKTTQAKLLAEKLSIGFIGAGDLLRERAEKNDPVGRALEADMERGELVDDGVIAELVKKEIEQEITKRGFVTDGYPRSLLQLKYFDPDYNKVFYLKISDQTAIDRLLNRGREDDTLEGIKHRLSWYHQQTQPVLDYYNKDGKLVVIDGEQPIELVAKAIEDYLRS